MPRLPIASPARIAAPGPSMTSTAVPMNSAAATGARLRTTKRVSAMPAPTVGSPGPSVNTGSGGGGTAVGSMPRAKRVTRR